MEEEAMTEEEIVKQLAEMITDEVTDIEDIPDQNPEADIEDIVEGEVENG